MEASLRDVHGSVPVPGGVERRETVLGQALLRGSADTGVCIGQVFSNPQVSEANEHAGGQRVGGVGLQRCLRGIDG